MPGKKITQTATIVSPPTYYQTIPIETSTLTLDEAWSPTWQASLRSPYTTQLAAVDPRRSQTIVELTTVEEYCRAMTCAEFTLKFSGVMSALTTAYGGKTCAQITNLINFPYDEALTGYIAPTIRTNRLMLREVSINHLEAKIDLALASEEALLQDYAYVGTSDLTPLPGNLQVLALINYALALVGRELLGYDSGLQDIYVTDEAKKAWKPGTTLYDWIYNIIRGVGKLYCRYDGQFVWRVAHSVGDGLPAMTLNTANIISAEENRALDGNFYTAAVITYRWLNGTTQTEVVDAYDSGRVPTRVYTDTFENPYPGPGSAASYLNVLQSRGELIQTTAIADWQTTWLNNTVNLTLPTGSRSGNLTKASLHYPSDEMEITTRIGLN